MRRGFTGVIRGYLGENPAISENVCKSCFSSRLEIFYEIGGVPTNSCLLMDSHEEAIKIPRGDIELTFCQDCGFIFNAAFDPLLTEYSSRYEETQAYSPTFNRFHRALAEELIEQYDLRHKRIMEIGCGKGEFLNLLCELGDNSGVGFDPGYKLERNHSRPRAQITFIQDFYSERYAKYCGDFICCKMTLEHIPDVSNFINMIRQSTEDAPSAVVYFQVPEAFSILRDVQFWDIYYEHCSYFTSESLRRLFTSCGFCVLAVKMHYGNQYLSIEARPAAFERVAPRIKPEQLEELYKCITEFRDKSQGLILYWQQRLRSCEQQGKRVVLWGSSSKSVSFLTSLGIKREVDYVVDINPYKQGKFMPGSGHKIVAPEYLKSHCPDLIVLVNPIYRDEIQEMLDGMAVSTELESVCPELACVE